jgi:signal transduction histidine kinase
LVGVLQVARIVNNIEEFLQNLKYMLLLAGVFTTALAASLGWFLAKKTLQPIEVVIDATRQIQNSEDLNLKIEYFGPQDEIGRLTETINGMLGRIQVSYENLADSIRAQRRFVADASHELRTPLTTIRGNVDLLRKIWNPLEDGPELDEESKMSLSLEAIHDISEEAERMSRLVNDLLTLARSDAGIQMAKESIELLPIIAEVVRKAQFFPKSVRFEVGEFAALENVFVIGNKDYLQQLFFIFLENAFKYTMEGCVRLDVTRTDHQVGIRISDTGLGLDEAEIPLIFERFYRADPSRGVISGTGLGLSIAKWIMDEHEGSIEVMTMREEGTTFVIWLPAYSPTFDEPLHFEI